METKQCQNCKIKFTVEPEDFKFYEKIGVPAPTFCSKCRMQRRFSFRNQRKIYKRKCDFSGEDIFSIFPPESSVKVYKSNFWNSDQWDPMEYGREYNFKKPFFGQLDQLRKEVPCSSGFVIYMINSDYCANAGKLKNCYLVFESSYCEDCAYCVEMAYAKDCYDNLYLSKCELSYESFMSVGCYKIFFSSECSGCREVLFSLNCTNCVNCFGCVNLKHKKYHIFNQSYSREEYFKKLESFDLGSYKSILSLKKKAKNFWLKFPNKYMHGQKNINVTGDDIYNSKNVLDSYTIKDGENLKYCQFIAFGPGTKNCYDYSTWGENANLIYETISSGEGISKLKFCCNCDASCQDFEYCLECFSSFDLFGCVGLRDKKYCILNKQYTKKEYKKLVVEIKKHMNEMPYIDKKKRIYKYGEFFPAELSPFGYNETMANEYYPLTKEEVIQQGYNWYDKPEVVYKATVKASDLPDHIQDVNETILKEVIKCSNKNCAGSGVFRLILQEYKFYKKQGIPIPHLCPECRYQERVKQRNPLRLWKRQCMKKGCSTKFETSYAPERKEIIYCESCYNREVG